MTAQTIATLKGYFNTGDIPTEAQFANLIDSFASVSEENTFTIGQIFQGGDVVFRTTNTGIGLNDPLVIFDAGSNGFAFGKEAHIDWYDGLPTTTNLDLILWRAGTRAFGLKLAGTKASPQPMKFRINNYYADGGVNQEFGEFLFSSNVFTIATRALGDGSVQPMQFSVGTSLIYYNTTNFMPNTPLALGRTDGDHRWTNVFTTLLDVSSNATILGKLGVGLTPTANMSGVSIEAGLLTLKETTTPTADTNYGKIYTKSDNKLYFQDGAGAEHEIAYTV